MRVGGKEMKLDKRLNEYTKKEEVSLDNMQTLLY